MYFPQNSKEISFPTHGLDKFKPLLVHESTFWSQTGCSNIRWRTLIIIRMHPSLSLPIIILAICYASQYFIFQYLHKFKFDETNKKYHKNLFSGPRNQAQDNLLRCWWWMDVSDHLLMLSKLWLFALLWITTFLYVVQKTLFNYHNTFFHHVLCWHNLNIQRLPQNNFWDEHEFMEEWPSKTTGLKLWRYCNSKSEAS